MDLSSFTETALSDALSVFGAHDGSPVISCALSVILLRLLLPTLCVLAGGALRQAACCGASIERETWGQAHPARRGLRRVPPLGEHRRPLPAQRRGAAAPPPSPAATPRFCGTRRATGAFTPWPRTN